MKLDFNHIFLDNFIFCQQNGTNQTVHNRKNNTVKKSLSNVDRILQT